MATASASPAGSCRRRNSRPARCGRAIITSETTPAIIIRPNVFEVSLADHREDAVGIDHAVVDQPRQSRRVRDALDRDLAYLNRVRHVLTLLGHARPFGATRGRPHRMTR